MRKPFQVLWCCQGYKRCQKSHGVQYGRKLLQFGTAAVLSGITIPSGRHLSAEDHSELHHALGKSIAEGWKLFHTAGNTQVLRLIQRIST